MFYLNNMKNRLTRPLKIIILSLSILGLLSGCAHIFKGSQIPDLSKMTVDKIKDRLEQNYLKLNTLEGKGQFQAQMPGNGYEASVSTKLIMPDSLFAKFEIIFGLDIGTFTSNRKKFALYIPMKKLLYTGETDSVDLATFFQVNVNFNELIEAFTGVPKIDLGDTTALKISGDEYLLTSRTASGAHQYWIHPARFVVTKYQFYDLAGTLQVVKSFSRFQKFDEIYLPKSIRIEKPVQKQMFSLFYTQRQINEMIDKKSFKIRGIPRTVRHIKL